VVHNDAFPSTMATSSEEIQRQHDEALHLLESGMEYDLPNCQSEIPLSFKAAPTFQRDDLAEFENANGSPVFPVWSLRGNVNVDTLQDLFCEGYNDISSAAENEIANKKKLSIECVKSMTNLWDEANAAVNNVRICRPSHDAWGIKKVALIFSDDFLLTTYEMPWWHSRPDIQEAVMPILSVLGIEPQNVIRLLLASLPPGVTIPVHHDTGAWVTTTHRVHVPVLVRDAPRILFRAGLDKDKLQRIPCEPGTVFELNNQCYHAVSNCDTDYRVHLILDYASSSPPRIQLQPGEVLFQTRRTISRLADRGRRQTPSFLILGAQKAGTTSLYEYMNQHPLIVRARRRETHCLDWRWNAKLKSADQQRMWCRKFYFAQELDRHPSLLTGDSTPSYLLDSRRVIPRLKRVFDWPMRFFVTLRDPVRRAESHYAMVTSTEGTPAQLQARGSEWRNKSFRQVVEEDLALMSSCGLIPYFDAKSGRFDQSIWDEFSGSSEEDAAWDRYLSHIPLNTGSHCLLGRGLYEMNLRPWLRAFGSDSFLLVQLEVLSDRVNETMQAVWQHLGVPPIEILDDAPKNQRSYSSQVPEDLRSYLVEFFRPHNRRLESIAGKDWRDVWRYEQSDPAQD
jgi:hypothetical protein